MAHRAFLHLGTNTGVNEYEILHLNYKFEQSLNLGPVHGIWDNRITGAAAFLMQWGTGEVIGGDLELTVATLPDSDTIFHRWMFSRWRSMSGTIRIEMDAPQSARQTLTIAFVNGFCTFLEDKFDAQDGKVMTTTIKIKCQQLSFGTNIPAVWPAFI